MADNEGSVMDSEDSDRPADEQSSDEQYIDADNASDDDFVDQEPPKKKTKTSKANDAVRGSQTKSGYVILKLNPANTKKSDTTKKSNERTCSNCPNALGAVNYYDPGNALLCPACGQRLKKARAKARDSNVPLGDDWRTTRALPRTEDTCSNCSNSISGTLYRDPQQKALCGGCGKRLSRARVAAKKSGKPLGDAWRTIQRPGPAKRAAKDNSGNGGKDEAEDEATEDNSEQGGENKAGDEVGEKLVGEEPVGEKQVGKKDVPPGRGRWTGKRKGGQKPSELKCSNCPNSISALTKAKDLQGNLLCPTCKKDAWLKCSNCPNSMSPHTTAKDPQGKQLCTTCNKRQEYAIKVAKLAGRPVGEEWRSSGRDSPRCEDCETELLDEGRSDNLCEVCGKRHDAYDDRESPPPDRPSNASIPSMPLFTHAAIRDTAYESFRGLHPSFDPRVDAVRPPTSRHDYWNWGWQQLVSALRARGVGLDKFVKRDLIRWIQIADALDGILPNPDPTGASRLDRMSNRAKLSLGVEAGFKRRIDPERPTSDNLRRFLIDPDAPFVPDALASDDLECIARLLLEDLSASLPNQPNRARAIAEQATHQTHNHGLTGSEEAIQSLHDTMRYSLYPGDTSGAGLLCGARALANSRVARLRAMGIDPGMDAEEMTHQLMELLFTNYDRTTMPGSDMVGIPTPEYDTYIRAQLTLLAQTDVVHFNQEYFERTALNNVDVEQVAAMAYLAHQAQLGGVVGDFGLGVVVAAHTRRVHDGTLEDVPAHARIVRNGAADTPDIWIHHNTALSLDEYSHFEAFVPGDSLDALVEWGIETGASADVVPPARIDPAYYPSGETRTSRLRREITNSQAELRKHMKKFHKHCRRCRNLEFAECIGKPGAKCERCVKDKQPICHWDYDAPFVPSGKSGSELMDPTVFEEHMRLWDVPMSMQERAEYAEFARNNQPQPRPDGKHMLVIGCGRESSHAGMESIQRISGCVMVTVTTLSNLWNSPQHNNTPEGQRPGGPGAIRRLFTMAIARHGTKRIPCNTGNVRDPVLISHTNLIDQEMDPNNANPAFEIIYVLMGIAGLSVPLEGWVPFFRSILRRDSANGTNIADRIFIMPVVDPDVVNGTATSIFPNRPLQTWLRYRNKCVRKFKLRDLYERWLHQRYEEHCRQNNLPIIPVPMTPALQDLDDMLELMVQEGCWRSGDYDDVNPPTTGTLAARNNGRNAAWQ